MFNIVYEENKECVIIAEKNQGDRFIRIDEMEVTTEEIVQENKFIIKSY